MKSAESILKPTLLVRRSYIDLYKHKLSCDWLGELNDEQIAQLKQYENDKLQSLERDAAKYIADIEKMRATLPTDVSKQPKKTLQNL